MGRQGRATRRAARERAAPRSPRGHRLRYAPRVIRGGHARAGLVHTVPARSGPPSRAWRPLHRQGRRATAEQGRDRRVRGVGGDAAGHDGAAVLRALPRPARPTRRSGKNALIASLRLRRLRRWRCSCATSPGFARRGPRSRRASWGRQVTRLFRCGAGRPSRSTRTGARSPAWACARPSSTVRCACRLPRTRSRALRRPRHRRRHERRLPATVRAVLSHGLCEQCPAKSWSEHGTLDTPVEYHCEMAHAQARSWAG